MQVPKRTKNAKMIIQKITNGRYPRLKRTFFGWKEMACRYPVPGNFETNLFPCPLPLPS